MRSSSIEVPKPIRPRSVEIPRDMARSEDSGVRERPQPTAEEILHEKQHEARTRENAKKTTVLLKQEAAQQKRLQKFNDELTKIQTLIQDRYGHKADHVQDMALGIATIPLRQRLADGFRTLFRSKEHVKHEDATLSELLDTWNGLNNRVLDEEVKLRRITTEREQSRILPSEEELERAERATEVHIRRTRQKQERGADLRTMSSPLSLRDRSDSRPHLSDLKGLAHDLMEGLRGYPSEAKARDEREVQRYLGDLLSSETATVLKQQPDLNDEEARAEALERLYEQDLTWESVRDQTGSIKVKGVALAGQERVRAVQEVDLEMQRSKTDQPNIERVRDIRERMQNMITELEKQFVKQPSREFLEMVRDGLDRFEQQLNYVLPRPDTINISEEYARAYEDVQKTHASILEKFSMLEETVRVTEQQQAAEKKIQEGFLASLPPNLAQLLQQHNLLIPENRQAISYAIEKVPALILHGDIGAEHERVRENLIRRIQKQGVDLQTAKTIFELVENHTLANKILQMEALREQNPPQQPSGPAMEEQEMLTDSLPDKEMLEQEILTIIEDAFDDLTPEQKFALARNVGGVRLRSSETEVRYERETLPELTTENAEIDELATTKGYFEKLLRFYSASQDNDQIAAKPLSESFKYLNKLLFPAHLLNSTKERKQKLAEALEAYLAL